MTLEILSVKGICVTLQPNLIQYKEHSVRPSVRHTSLQNDVYGGVEPWWLKGKPLVTKWKGQKYIHKKYFCQKYFHQKYFHQKYFHQKCFCQKYFWKNIQIIFKCFVKNISKKIFHYKYFRKKYLHKKKFRKNTFDNNISEKRWGRSPLAARRA